MFSAFIYPITRVLPKLHPRRALTPFSTVARDHIWAKPTVEDDCTYPAYEVFEAGLRHHHTANTAYPIAHSKTLRPYRVIRSRDQEELSNAVRSAYGPLEEIMLYVHIPFCEQRCQFCEYTVVDPAVGTRSDVQDIYFEALMGEFDLYREILATDKKRLLGFDIGGGTPSLASIANLDESCTKWTTASILIHPKWLFRLRQLHESQLLSPTKSRHTMTWEYAASVWVYKQVSRILT